MLLDRCLRFTYRVAPNYYLALARRWWIKSNPQFMIAVPMLDAIVGGLPYGWWPIILFREGKRYIAQGGRAAFPATKAFEDALLCHVVQQGNQPGPVRDSWAAMQMLHEAAFEGEGIPRLKAMLEPLLEGNPRLAGMLDVDDLIQEAAAASAEVAQPWVDWGIGGKWSTTALRPTRAFLRRVTERLASRKYGADRNMERPGVKVPLEPTPEAIFADEGAEQAFGDSEWRVLLDQGMTVDLAREAMLDTMAPPEVKQQAVEVIKDTLLPKQREAVEVQHQAIIDGVSLEEKAQELGHNPKRVRNNVKAVQQRYR